MTKPSRPVIHGRDHRIEGADPIIGFNPVPVVADLSTDWPSPFAGQVVLAPADVTLTTDTGGSGTPTFASTACHGSPVGESTSGFGLAVPALTVGSLALAIIAAGNRDAGFDPPSSWTAPAGWSLVLTNPNSQLKWDLRVYKRIATVAESATTYTWAVPASHYDWLSTVLTFAGGNVSDFAKYGWDANPAIAPDVSADVLPAQLVSIFLSPGSGSLQQGFATPTGMTLRCQNFIAVGGPVANQAVYTQALAATGPTGTRSSLATGNTDNHFILASLIVS